MNIIKDNERLEEAIKELKKEHIKVCYQRDELNDLLGKMMYKNVRLKIREDFLKEKNKKPEKKLQKKKLMKKLKKKKLIKKGSKV